MSASFVQAGQGPGGTTSDAVTLGSSTPVGNLILAVFDWDINFAFSSISDDLGNTYTQVGSELSGNSTLSRMYWAKNATAGVRTVTANAAAGSTFMELTVEEITGQHLTSPIDSSASNTQAAVQSPTITDVTVANSTLLVAWGSANHPTSTVTTSGFSASRIPAGSKVIADKIISPAGSTLVTYNGGGSPPNWHLWLVGIAPPPATRIPLLTLLGVGT